MTSCAIIRLRNHRTAVRRALKGRHSATAPFFSPTHEETGAQEGMVSTSESFRADACVSLPVQESMIPNYLGPKMEIPAVG